MTGHHIFIVSICAFVRPDYLFQFIACLSTVLIQPKLFNPNENMTWWCVQQKTPIAIRASHWGSTLWIGRVTLGLDTADREGQIGARQCWSGGSHWGSTLRILRQQISSVSVTVYIYVSVSWWWHTQTSRRKGNKSTQYSQWCNLDQWQPEDSQPITTHH